MESWTIAQGEELAAKLGGTLAYVDDDIVVVRMVGIADPIDASVTLKRPVAQYEDKDLLWIPGLPDPLLPEN